MGNFIGNNLQFSKRAVEMQRLRPRHITCISVQKEIPVREYLVDDVPFAIGQKLIVNSPLTTKVTQTITSTT